MIQETQIRKITTPRPTQTFDDTSKSRYRLGYSSLFIFRYTFSKTENIAEIQEGIRRFILEPQNSGRIGFLPWETSGINVFFIEQFGTQLTVKIQYDNFLARDLGDFNDIVADFRRIDAHTNRVYNYYLDILTPDNPSIVFSPIPKAWSLVSAVNESMVSLVDRPILTAPTIRLTAEEEQEILRKRKERVQPTPEEAQFILERRKREEERKRKFEESIPPKPKPKPERRGFFGTIFDTLGRVFRMFRG